MRDLYAPIATPPAVVRLGKYMRAARSNPLGQRPAYEIVATDGSRLASVEWYPRWRRFVLADVDPRAVLSGECLRELENFCERETRDYG